MELNRSERATHGYIMEMVKKAEQQLELDLYKKRDRLKSQVADESLNYQQEIQKKYQMLRELQLQSEVDALQRLKIDRELDRQKFVELKKLQQHFKNSEEVRLESSRKLLEDCAKSRIEQIQEKHNQNALYFNTEKMMLDEDKRRNQEQIQRELEIERIAKLQKNWEARQDLEKQLKIKNEKTNIKRNELDLERRILQQHDETLKKKEEDLKKIKLQDEKIQKEFLRRQIEERKKEEEIRRQKEIRSDKLAVELVKQQLHQETEQAIQAKHVQQLENLQFSEYMEKIRLGKRELEKDQRDFKLASRLTEEIEANAESKRQQKKQQLYAEQRNDYLNKMRQKHEQKIKEKQMGLYELKKTQQLNDEYEQMMAARKIQNRTQFQQDLDRQIELKNMELAWNLEQDAKIRQEMEALDTASKRLTKKLLNDGSTSTPSHPFYHCLNK